ncbi:MAG: hypothetical protein ACI8QC_003156 [Planctomycetota bacterium]|jgi:hypothetical protein
MRAQSRVRANFFLIEVKKWVVLLRCAMRYSL